MIVSSPEFLSTEQRAALKDNTPTMIGQLRHDVSYGGEFQLANRYDTGIEGFVFGASIFDPAWCVWQPHYFRHVEDGSWEYNFGLSGELERLTVVLPRKIFSVQLTMNDAPVFGYAEDIQEALLKVMLDILSFPNNRHYALNICAFQI